MFNQINQVMKQESFTVSNEIVELSSNYEKIGNRFSLPIEKERRKPA
jgi:hypothetical protein